MTTYYDENSEFYIDNTVNLDMSHFYPRFIKHLASDALILDAGAGSGRDSKYFLQQGFRVYPIDGSKALAESASVYIGQPVHHLRFDQIDFENHFDAIWACASLLHVPRADMGAIFDRFTRALKPNGIFYVSYKWGMGDRTDANGRIFTDYDSSTFETFLQSIPKLSIIDTWQTADIRNRGNNWLNVFMRKNSSEYVVSP